MAAASPVKIGIAAWISAPWVAEVRAWPRVNSSGKARKLPAAEIASNSQSRASLGPLSRKMRISGAATSAAGAGRMPSSIGSISGVIARVSGAVSAKNTTATMAAAKTAPWLGAA